MFYHAMHYISQEIESIYIRLSISLVFQINKKPLLSYCYIQLWHALYSSKAKPHQKDFTYKFYVVLAKSRSLSINNVVRHSTCCVGMTTMWGCFQISSFPPGELFVKISSQVCLFIYHKLVSSCSIMKFSSNKHN